VLERKHVPHSLQRYPAAAAALVLAASLSGVLSCSAGEELESNAGEAPSQRVLILGIDGASNKLIEPMMAAGELPHLAAIASKGVRGYLRPGYPLLSPRIWTTVATGREPEEHGIEHWVKRDESGAWRLFTNSDRRVHALWNIVGARGRRVGVVNWLITQPPDKVNGVMITDHALPGMTESRIPMARKFARGFDPGAEDVMVLGTKTAYAHPEEWVARAAAAQRIDAPLTGIANPFYGPGWADTNRLIEFFRRVFEEDQVVTRTALTVENELRPALLMVYLPGVDRISHFLWDGIEIPDPPPPHRTILPEQVRAKHRATLKTYYRFTDALIGLLAASFGPDDLVVVISDHGFEAGAAAGTMPGDHTTEEARDGILYARGPGLPAGETVETIAAADLAPTVLAWLGLPIAGDMAGRPAPYLSAPTVERIATYETSPIERVDTPASPAEEAILEQLRELGYVE
jgi:hypothetical protein